MPSTKYIHPAVQSKVGKDTIMDFSTLSSLDAEALTTALALDFDTLDAEALTAAHTERQAERKRLFALESPSIAEVDVAEALTLSVKEIEAAQAEAAKVAKEAGERFANLKAQFAAEGDDTDDSTEDGDEADEDADDSADDADEADEADDADADDSADADADAGDADAGDGDGVTTASMKRSQKATAPKASAAKNVGKRTTRPRVAGSAPGTITAAANVDGFTAGQRLSGMDQTAEAVMAQIATFPPYNQEAALAANHASGGQPQRSKKHPVAMINMDTSKTLVASGTAGQEYRTAQQIVKDHQKAVKTALDKGNTITAAALTAAGWCAPSPYVMTWLSDRVVDGLWSGPEIPAPRGGLQTTTGPERSSQGTALDDFGWTQTEAQAIARTAKTFETIVCPEFTDHRLDVIGYGYNVPILTESAFPELVSDTLQFASVLHAHRTNRRIITDILTDSSAVVFEGYGPSMTDSLEALELAAVAERRKWNLGKDAVMEVKVPTVAEAVYRADMSRRNGVALLSVTSADIAKHFADRNLAVEYLSDWEEISVDSGKIVLPGAFTAIMYPSGTWAKAFKPVINLGATYDAASLTYNEYLAVFFEQAMKMIKIGYRSLKISIPINTAGEQGALTLTGLGDAVETGSF